MRVSVSTRVSLPTYVTVGKDGCDGACVCVRACSGCQYACFDKSVTKSLISVSFRDGEGMCACV